VDLYGLDDPSIECTLLELLGVFGTTPVETRLLRAVSGVGALIKDFFGVSVKILLVRLLVKLVDEVNNDFAVFGEGLVAFERFPAEM